MLYGLLNLVAWKDNHVNFDNKIFIVVNRVHRLAGRQNVWKPAKCYGLLPSEMVAQMLKLVGKWMWQPECVVHVAGCGRVAGGAAARDI